MRGWTGLVWRRRAAAALGTVLIATLAPSPSWADEMTVVRRTPTADVDWVAYRISTTTGWALNIVGGPDDARLWGAGVWTGHVGASDWSRIAVTGWGDDLVYTDVRVGIVGDVLVLGDPRISEDYYRVGWGCDSCPGHLVLVAVAAGPYRGDFVLRGGPDLVVHEELSGRGSRIYGGEDFGSVATVAAGGSVDLIFQNPGGSAGAMAAGRITASSDHSLFGWFRPGIGVAEWRGPDGARNGGAVLSAAGAGQHVFEVTVAAEAYGRQFLWFADVELPSRS